MNSFTLLLVCVQVFLFQYTSGQCYEPAYYAPPCAAPVPILPAPVPIIPAPACGGQYGIKVAGNGLTIDGLAQITGTVPFASSVQLDGEVPAEGTASLRNACNCGDALLR